ncbi:MAG TPA: peptidoglycan editing factor PgeF [Steroidobacteraceae bacterium]|nr:peptidoglycan editing factor PgeF [Steroidobacteraceae bacterium]
MSSGLPLLAPDWRAPPGVRALVTTRRGGVSAAPREELNLAAHVGDTAAAVAENRRRLRAAAALPDEPRWLHQVHGAAVADLDAGAREHPVQADAAVTGRAGTVCAVLTADCLPVLLAAGDGSAVAIAHAGWRGLAAGVLEATVAALRTRIAAGVALACWIGPAISARHFEVRADVREPFLAADAENAAAFVPGRAGHWQCDLPWLARRQLQRLGVAHIADSGRCTYAEEAHFYSHRRDVQHRGLAGTGRFATLIWLQP